MSIEQSIFTCCRARRETGTTGFGYYSLTEGMDTLRRDNVTLSMVSNNYSAPRNQELWWSDLQDDDERDRAEAEAIKEHHPTSFSYRVLEVGGVKKAVFTFGKNLGRDIQGYRPGNILVNTIVCDLDDFDGYPFEYYGSPEIFTDYDRSFFVNTPDTPADMLENPTALHTGGKLTREDAAEFIAADDRRLDLLLSMIQFTLDHNDPDQTQRQVMICDRKENIIYWAAAVSLIFPPEIAKEFSFSTYSFLGSADSSSVSLEDIMLCGVYSAAVNDDEEDPRATNYNYDFEAERIESALFDFEHEFFTGVDLRNNGFNMLVRSAMLGSFEQLDEFQRFIMEKTTCRTIGNDYAKGCACFLIAKMRHQQTLTYLSDAQYFAEKYMGAEAVRALLEIAYACSLDNDEMTRYFSDIMAMSRSCANNSEEDKAFVYEHCLRFIREAFLSQSLSREEYFCAKNAIKELFEEHGESFEQAFIGSLDSGVISMRIQSIEKKWMLFDLAEMLCRDAAASGKDLYSRDCLLMLTAVYRAVHFETEERKEFIGVYLDMFESLTDKLKLCDLMIAMAENDQEVRTDLICKLAEITLGSENSTAAQIFEFTADKPFRPELYRQCRELLEGLDDSLRLYSAMLDSSEVYRKYLPEICDRLLDLTKDVKCDTALENIFHVFLFAQDHDALNICGEGLCIEYCNTVLNSGVWFRIGERAGAILRELVEGSKSSYFVDNPDAHNIFVMYYITHFAETDDESLLPFMPDTVGQLDVEKIRDEEYLEVKKTIAHAFARRSIVTGSALDVRYDLFIDLDKIYEPPFLDEITVLWFREIMKTAPKDIRAKLTAQVLAIMHIDTKANFETMGAELYANKIKAADVVKWFDDRDILKFIVNCRGTEKELGRNAALLENGYERAKQNSSLFGNLFSRRGKKG